MSIIAIEGLKEKWSLMEVVKLLKPIIGGQFEPLSFESTGRERKTCHVRLSTRHNPAEVLSKINSRVGFQKANIRATIPEEESDKPLPSKLKIPQKMTKALNTQVPTENRPEQILTVTQMEILMEMQAKFTGLFNLSRKTPGHQLLEDIARTIFERLYSIMKSNAEAAASCFKLSQCYRKLHPHFGDFQLILGRLHAAETARGAPRTQLTEDALTAHGPTQPYSIDNIPYDKIQAATSKYSLKITNKILEHIRSLKCDVDIETDTEEELARKRVRQELHNVAQYLPSMIRQVIQKHLSPEKTPFNRIRIYGEPYLPGKRQLYSILQRHRAVKLFRSDRMYNLLKCSVPPECFSSFMSFDGTVIGNTKLVIRSCDIPLYKVPDALLAEMKALFGVVHTPMDYFAHGDDEEPLVASN